ncbi:hypothetical protein [Stenotrophomonas sp. Marseille-Q5258]|uniref:hypothetical protein n=1 Tax=Stenotrophomonas TaxID=40323 RepID=UPI0021C756B5|nr:hypothetical protein [Stenotrophomonas sp. Marseille-Q5258]
MTQRHISHPEGLPACAAGHSARHIYDLRCLAAGGGHLVECRCRATSKHAEPNAAIAEWRRINRPARSARKILPAIDTPAAAKVVQLDFGMTLASPPGSRTGGSYGRG